MSSEPTPAVAVLEQAAFIRACSRFATGVTLVTVADDLGQPHGMTVNSFTSVSLDPLLFLVCIDNRAKVKTIVAPGTHLAVNVLEEGQQWLSSRFARPIDDRFATVEWAPGVHGAPLIAGALATIEGAVMQTMAAGDHTIVLVEARSTSIREGRPLIFYGSRYQQLGELVV